jgi:hypothetical protein
VTTVTTPNSEVSVDPAESLYRAEASSFGFIRFHLPNNPTLGETHTFQENGATTTDETGTYTGGMGVETDNQDHLIDGVQQYWTSTPLWYMTVQFNGTQWTVTDEGYFTP